MPKLKLVLKGFTPIKGDTKRRHVNKKTGEVISRREFVNRAKRVTYEPKPKKPKVRETIHQKRVRWYANHINREVWLSGDNNYISFEDAANDVDFKYFEALIKSRYREDRVMGYSFFEELEEEFLYEDWGTTP